MACPRCNNNAPKTVIYECPHCKTIFCMIKEGSWIQRQTGGCADKGACPNCHKSPDSSARRLRKL